MALSEHIVTKAIASYFVKVIDEYSNVDVVIVGAGPSGMTAAYYLAKAGLKVLVLEKRLSFGGGIGGGGSHLPAITIEEEIGDLLRSEFGVKTYKYNGIHVIDPAELIAKLAYKSIEAGAKYLLGVYVEDVIVKGNPPRVTGVAFYWSSIKEAGYSTDPIFIEAKAVIDATGHEAHVVNVVARKNPSFGISIRGEGSADIVNAERLVVEHTGKVVEGLYVAGMAVAAIYGLPRMGPIFGGMILSGKKVAEVVIRDVRG